VQVRRTGGHITLRDRPAPFWALGLFLLAGGVIAVAMPLGLATNAADLEPWQRLVSIVMGLGVTAGALWWLAQSPSTRVDLDLTRRRVRVVRLGLGGREVRHLAFDDIEGVEIEQSTDSDGGAVWRPVVRLRTGSLVRLSELWSHDGPGVRESMAVVAEACRLPQPNRSGSVARGTA